MFDRNEVLEKEAVMAFNNAIKMRYEDWKQGNLIAIALQNMPKQVKPEKVTENLIQLKHEFAKGINDVSAPAPTKKRGLWALFV